MRLIVEEERRRSASLHVDSLLALVALREERRVTTAEVARRMQRDDAAAKAVLEELVEAGIVEAHGQGRGRSYTLSAKTYRHLGLKAEYVRQVGFDAEQHEQMVRKFVRSHGSIRAADAMNLCNLKRDQASRLLRALARGDPDHGRGPAMGGIPTGTEAMSARIELCARSYAHARARRAGATNTRLNPESRANLMVRDL